MNFIERSSQDVSVAHLFIVYLLLHHINTYYLFVLDYLSVRRKLELIKAFSRYATTMDINIDPLDEDDSDEESGSGKIIYFLAQPYFYFSKI